MSDAPEQTWAVTEPDDSNIDQFSPYHDGSMQFDKDGGWVSYDDYKEAADRIEELEAKLSKSEALLAKAVEALEQIATHRKKCHEYDDDVGHERRTFDVEDMIIMEYAARTTLAELKGPDHGRR